MAADLPGLKKRLNAKMNVPGLTDELKKKARGVIQDTINDLCVEAIKSSGLEQWVAEKVSEAAAAVGFDLSLTKISDKEQTRVDVDKAITAKINALAGTNFDSIRKISRDAINTEVGRMIGEKLGVGNLFPVSAFRDVMGGQLVQAFEGAAGPAGALFAPHILEAVENNVVAGWKELTTKSMEVGNPMNKAGPPRDAAHAEQRAAGRKRQAKYRAKHFLHWVPFGEGASTGNGREGLTGKASGNVKPVKNRVLNAKDEGYQYY